MRKLLKNVSQNLNQLNIDSEFKAIKLNSNCLPLINIMN
jgi:hypothetical protein